MQRRYSREIKVGSVTVGGSSPISVQSMLCAPPSDIEANCRQAQSLYEAGCDIIRVAIPTQEDLRLIPAIKKAAPIPLVADIQFDYRLAIGSAREGADKVRINPGNIGSREKTALVVEECTARKLPIRIGVNSGSLEKSILKKYGRPCADALVESALLNINLLEEFGFKDYLVAIKSSDVATTIEAYRKIAALTDCPLHLGVTEAGGERMGIIKSSAAIGSLLCDGIGDTIRVSLTADPVLEVRAAKDLLRAINLSSEGIQLVSCPTCGRCKVDLIGIANEVERAAANCKKKLKVAIMGCAVNGPGEASDADIGLAGGAGEMLLFKKGVVVAKVPQEQAVKVLLDEIDKM